MHYRLFFSSDKWLTAADLYNADTGTTREVTLTIERVSKGEMVGNKGKKSFKPALHWKERAKDGSIIKPLGCCVENCEALVQVTGSIDPKDWVGKCVTIFVKMIDMRGEGRRPAIRIKPFTNEQQRGSRGTGKSEPPPSASPSLPPDADEAAMIAELERMGVDRG